MTNEQIAKDIAALRASFEQMVPVFGALMSYLKGATPAPGPVVVQPEPVPVPPPAPTPVLEKPGVGLGILGTLLTLLLQANGTVGPALGDAATTTGQMLPILTGGTALLGATGMWGTVLNAVGTVFSAITQAQAKPK